MKTLLKLLPILILLLALIGGLVLVRKVQETRRGAFFGEATASFYGQQTGDQLPVALVINLGDQKLLGFTMKINYPKDLIRPVAGDNGVLLNSVFTKAIGSTNGVILQRVNPTEGAIYLSAVSLTEPLTGTLSGDNALVRINFEVIGSGQATVAVDTNYPYYQMVGLNAGDDKEIKLKGTASAEEIKEVFDVGISPSETPTLNQIEWKTDYVALKSENFSLEIDPYNYRFNGGSDVYITSDPGSRTYQTLEATWKENNREMRVFIYFAATANRWWVSEIRTYNGQEPGGWLYYSPDIAAPMGSAFVGDVELTSDDGLGAIRFDSLKIQPFLNLVVDPGVGNCDDLCQTRGFPGSYCGSVPVTADVSPVCKVGELDVGETTDCSAGGLVGVNKSCCCVSACITDAKDCDGPNGQPRLCVGGAWVDQPPCKVGTCVNGECSTEKCTRCVGDNGADRSKGDANCDIKIDPLDYTWWVKEYLQARDEDGNPITKNDWQSDFNCDGQVTGLDFNTLLRNIIWE